MNMKFINYLFIFFISLSSCTNKKNVKNWCQTYPPYKLIIEFSQKINPETNLVLRSYGINWCLPKGYQKKGIGNFSASYSLSKKKNENVLLDDARKLTLFVAENFLQEINSNGEITPELDVYPLTSEFLDLCLHFEDENRIDLGQGVAIVYFNNGKIKYEGYDIHKYTGSYPAEGKHFVMHEETYAEALEIVKKQGGLTYLKPLECVDKL